MKVTFLWAGLLFYLLSLRKNTSLGKDSIRRKTALTFIHKKYANSLTNEIKIKIWSFYCIDPN